MYRQVNGIYLLCMTYNIDGTYPGTRVRRRKQAHANLYIFREDLYNLCVRQDSPAPPVSGKKLRYHSIRDAIRRDIEGRRFAPGDRLPSDGDLATRFDASRLTVIRALKDLEHEGLVQRKAGSGTFVRAASATATRTFGILMPDLGDGEVFEPIAQGIAQSGESLHHRMLWGSAPAHGQLKESYAEDLCRYFLSRKVSGVFFAPVELTAHQDDVNRRITEDLTAAGVPIVLVDRCIRPYPERSPYDLAGIDNHRAGFRMTERLVRAGCRRIAFAFRPGSAPTVAARMAGYRTALFRDGGGAKPLTLETEPDTLAQFLKRERPDGIVCANDLTAAKLMHRLLPMGVRIPEDIRMVGINDVKYASFLPVPLTTLRQPCGRIGAAAMATMLDRIANPTAPIRDILLDCELVVRQSCGVPEP
jgi:GntR family transcriptional regulator of arabinose operon